MNETDMRFIITAVRSAFPDDPDLAAPTTVSGAPEAVAQWLSVNVPHLHTRISYAGPVEIAGVCLAGLYGPRDAGLIPAQDLTELLTSARFKNPADARAVERAVVHAARLQGRRGWAAPWPGAWDILFQMVRIQIHSWMTWLATELKQGLEAELQATNRRWFHSHWHEEIDRCAALIRGALVLGRCDCHERGEDFHVPTDNAAADCFTHSLQDWDGAQPLGQFIWYRAVREHPGLAKSVQEFRRGMLAKVAARERLAAGETMRCRSVVRGAEQPPGKNPTCWAEVRSNDYCVRGHFPTGVNDLTWRLWLKGERIRVECRKCNNCNCIYFQFKGLCPRCGARNWSQRLSHAYAPLSHFPLVPDEAVQEVPRTNSGLTPARQVELKDAIEQRLREPHRTFARRLLLQDRNADIDGILHDLNLNRQDGQRIIREVCQQLADLLLNPPQPTPDNEPEVSR